MVMAKRCKNFSTPLSVLAPPPFARRKLAPFTDLLFHSKIFNYFSLQYVSYKMCGFKRVRIRVVYRGIDSVKVLQSADPNHFQGTASIWVLLFYF